MMHNGKTIKDETTFNVYSDQSQDRELADKLLDLFIRAFMKSELEELQAQRDNICPQSSNKEDESNE